MITFKNSIKKTKGGDWFSLFEIVLLCVYVEANQAAATAAKERDEASAARQQAEVCVCVCVYKVNVYSQQIKRKKQASCFRILVAQLSFAGVFKLFSLSQTALP